MDYEIEVSMNGKVYEVIPVFYADDDILATELENARANYPGCNTQVYIVTLDVNGGTATVISRREM